MVVFKGLLLEFEQKLEEWKDEGALTRRGDRRWPLPSILRWWSHLIDFSTHISQHTTCASQDLRPVNGMPAQNQALASNVSEFLQLEVPMKFHTKRSCTEWVPAFCRIYSLTGCKAVSALQTHDLKIPTNCKADKKSAWFSLVSTLF